MTNWGFPSSPSSVNKEGVDHSAPMNEYVLEAPNSQLLSDRVIGGVVERARTSQRHTTAQIPVETIPPTPFSYSRQWPGEQGGTTFSSINLSTRVRERHQSDPASLIGGPILSTSEEKYLAMAKLAISEKIRLRELRRMRQIRYRQKKENYMLSLEEEVGQLRQKIEKLEQRRRSVCADVPAEMNAWGVVAEYFRLFRFGMRDSSLDDQSPSQLDAQLEFLNASFTVDVAFNASNGVDKMAQYWQQISRWFPSIEMDLDRLEKEAVGSLVATTATTVFISEQLLRSVFPHLHVNSGSDTCDALADKLLDKSLTLQGSVHFEWDSTSRRITRITSQSDMLSPLLRLLGSLEDVARVFQEAVVTPDFQVVNT